MTLSHLNLALGGCTISPKEMMCDASAAIRAEIMDAALDDAKRWCVGQHEAVLDRGTKRSDQYWLAQMSGSGTVTEADARGFCAAFGLNQGPAWDPESLARTINDFRARRPGDVVTDVEDLARQLGKCKGPGNSIEISAASKIAFFSRPAQPVYVWDKLARYALWRRAILNSGDVFARSDADAPYVTPRNAPNYAWFVKDGTNALDEELQRADFSATLSVFCEYLGRTSGPMASMLRGDMSFIRRRLADKLLWQEGRRLTSRR